MKKLSSFVALLLGVTVVLAQTPSLEGRLQGKTTRERANIKAQEIVSDSPVGIYTKNGYRIEIQGVSAIEGGVEVFARAWKGQSKVGFGDGTVEIERFRIFNPPVLVPDPSGSVERSNRDSNTQEIIKHFYREDPSEAVRQDLAHTISLVGKDGARIIPGKVGNTTSTFYPDPHPETTTFDGSAFRFVDNSTFSGIRDGSGNGSDDTSTAGENFFQMQDGTTNNTYRGLVRSFFLFDTSSITSSNNVDSGTFSFRGGGKLDDLGISPSANIYTVTTGSNTAVANSDYNIANWSSTELATSIAYASLSTSGYNDFTLNASGLAAISKTGVTKIGGRNANYDAADSAYTTVNNGANTTSYFQGFFADNTGTTNDPKLVVVHSVPVPDLPQVIWF